MHHRELRRSRAARFRGQATCVLDAEGHFINVSPSLAAFFQCDGSTLRGQSLLACMGDGEAGQVAPRLWDTLRGVADATPFEVRLLGPGGATWVTMRLTDGGHDAAGRPLAVATFTEPT